MSEYEILPAGDFLTQLQETENAILIDLRTSPELESGMIPGALHLDIFRADFISELKKLDLKAPIFIYCEHGIRSQHAAAQLKELGAASIFELEGGFIFWDGSKSYPSSSES